MSVGNQAQAINFANKSLVLVIGENMDLGGDDAGARNGTGKTTIINALSYVNNNISLIDDVKNKLQCNSEDLISKIDILLEDSRENIILNKKIENSKINDFLKNTNILYNLKDDINIFKNEIDYNIDVKNFSDQFNSHYNKKSIFLLGVKTEKPLIVLCATKDLSNNVINAGLVVKEIAKSIGSGGGGPSHFGTAGFSDNAMYDKAFGKTLNFLKKIDV